MKHISRKRGDVLEYTHTLKKNLIIFGILQNWRTCNLFRLRLMVENHKFGYQNEYMMY